MKQQNFLFVDIISSIFLLIILIGNFMGMLYITEGNIAISLLGSIFLVVCYFFVVQLLKKNKEMMYKKNFLHPSILFWFFFLFLGFVSFYLMSHFINIEYNCKAAIQKEATAKINVVEDLAREYKVRANDDIQNFNSELKSKLDAYKNTPTVALKNQLTARPFNISKTSLESPSYISVNELVDAIATPYQIKVDNNIKNIDSTLKLNNRNYQSVFDNWKRLSLLTTYSKLNDYVEDNIKTVNSKINELPLDKTPIKKTFNKSQLPLNNPQLLNAIPAFKPNYLIPSLFILITHLFILIPFFTWKIVDYVKSNNDDPLEIENVREI